VVLLPRADRHEQLEIAILPSYMNGVDLDPFGKLSVFLIECAEPNYLLPSKLDRRPHRGAQIDNSSNERRPASAAAINGPT
jgi:hypothetical protein